MARKKISELTSLASASLDTVVVGVDNGVTYKIELDILADGVKDRINTLDAIRLNNLQTFSASTLTRLDEIESQNSQLNSFTQSQNAVNTTFTNGINSRLQTASFETFSASVDSRIIAATNEQDLSYLVTTSSFNTYTASISTASLVDRLSELENNTASYLTTLDGAISSSSQLTSSFDGRYVLSGSITQTTWDNIANKPTDIISSSAQISVLGFTSQSVDISALNSFTQSQNAANTAFTNGINARLQTSSFNEFSASVDTRINSIVTESGSNLTYFIEAYANDTYTLPGGFTEDICRYSVVSATENIPSNWFNTSSYTFTPQKAGYWEIIASYDVYRNAEASLVIKKNNNIVASAGSFNAVAQDISKIVYLNGSTDYINIYNVGGAALQRDQYQSRSWFQAKFVGVVSGSTDLLSTNNTFTGNNTFEGTTTFETVGGDEGGEFQFGIPQTNTTLQNRVNVDVWQNRLRIFEGSVNSKGVFIDLSKAPTGVAGEITYKVSGIVNAGTFVQLDNIKATVTSSSPRGLSIATVSGTFNYNIGGNFAGAAVGSGGFSTAAQTLTTTPTTSIFGWGFMAQGETSTYILTDITNNRAYRITLQIGGSFNNNFISIERLH